MRFYKIEAEAAKNEELPETAGALERELREMTSRRMHSGAEGAVAFAVNRCGERLVCGLAAKGTCDEKKEAAALLKALGAPEGRASVREVTVRSAVTMVSTAYKNGFVEDERELLAFLGLDTLDCGPRAIFTEELLAGTRDVERLREMVRDLPCRYGLTAELERIASSGAQAVRGHPVHYVLKDSSAETAARAAPALLEALWSAGRVQNGRYSVVSWPYRGDDDQLEKVYAANSGGAVVIKVEEPRELGEEDGRVLSRAIEAHRHDVLTVLCVPDSCGRELYPQGFPWLEIGEDTLTGNQAEQYLAALAEERGVSPRVGLYEGLREEKKYAVSELRERFDTWFTRRLQTDYYPQYAFLTRTPTVPAGGAYESLQRLVGLEEVKTVIRQAVDCLKLQRVRERRGVKCVRPTMHMAFEGNPGTAKTTVARLLGQILRENGLLRTGNLVEASRADLVGRYVGWTAANVRRKFREAQGGVLFIDEAYTLVDDRANSFGDEAIDAITQEMENHREDTAVILAGYPRETELFLDRNPGLRSRVAFQIRFPDYSPEELCAIAHLAAEERGLRFSEDAEEKLRAIFEKASQSESFGNGRGVRNLIDRAMMRQASRLTRAEGAWGDGVDILTAEDFESDITAPAQGSGRRIGF